MSTTLTEIPAQLDPPRKLWTRAECSTLEAAGLLDGQHLELIEGDLINKMGKKRPHVSALGFLTAWAIRVFGEGLVNTEAPIDVGPEDNPTNEPEPDLIVLNGEPKNFVSGGNPRPADLRLVVEVADTSLQFDLTTKAALYARAGIVEYWVLDVAGRRLIVHRDPQQGGYSSIVEFTAQESVAPLAAPQANFRVAAAFPA